jgi:nucleoside 2-deoxyribosyltransferase
VKVFITARFDATAKDKDDVARLSAAVHEAKMKDFCFVRDVEHYKHIYDDPHDLWEKVFDELGACDALLIDISEHPGNGRVVEVGIAYALHKPIIVVKKPGVEHDYVYDGVSSVIIEYKDMKDLTRQLIEYDKERNFTVTDKGALLAMFLLVGAVLSWTASQLFLPLGLFIGIIYWLIVRKFSASLRAYDRIVIYIPLAVVWLYGFFALQPLYLPLALAWAIIYWIVVLFTLRKLKFSL